MKPIRFLLLVVLAVFLIACESDSNVTGWNNGNGDGGGNGGGTGDGGGGTGSATSAIIADHSAAAAFGSIPSSYVSQAISNFRIFYGHTSHGSQILTGLQMLQNATYNYAGLSVTEEGTDLGDSSWPTITRTRLNEAGNNINVVMWSWCGQASESSTNINSYLTAMNQLESEYPSVRFIYMTGHTDGTGESGTLRTHNREIRDYVSANNKVLFDFADIESWDPGGTYYADTSDDCGWCSTWCGAHTCGPYSISCTNDSDCAHSHCFNCYLKGEAFWWLLARLAGWSG